MNTIEQKHAAREFVKRWKAMPCVEEEHSRSFWIELLQDVLGVSNATRVLEPDFCRTNRLFALCELGKRPCFQ